MRTMLCMLVLNFINATFCVCVSLCVCVLGRVCVRLCVGVGECVF